VNDKFKGAAGASGLWEHFYSQGRRLTRYPYDTVVGFTLRRFGAGLREGVRILDYGCGGGNNARFLAAEGFDLYAVDSAPTAIELTRACVAEILGEANPDKIRVGDFGNLPFPDMHFDAVIDRQSLDQNAAVDLPGLVNEIFRVLKPGGLYFGINFSDGHPQIEHGRHLGGGDYAEFTGGMFKGLGQKHFFSVSEAQTLFANFEIEAMDITRITSAIGKSGGSEEIAITAKRPV